MTLLFSYDIEDDRLRLRMANKLLETGFVRLQKSVFLATHLGEGHWTRLLDWTRQQVMPQLLQDDQILYLPLTELQTLDFGFLPEPPNEWQELLDPPNTLFI